MQFQAKGMNSLISLFSGQLLSRNQLWAGVHTIWHVSINFCWSQKCVWNSGQASGKSKALKILRMWKIWKKLNINGLCLYFLSILSISHLYQKKHDLKNSRQKFIYNRMKEKSERNKKKSFKFYGQNLRKKTIMMRNDSMSLLHKYERYKDFKLFWSLFDQRKLPRMLKQKRKTLIVKN